MKVVLREEESGVSEVVGTILILAMTVVLFSTIILWVTNIPTPTTQARVDVQASLVPFYGAGGKPGGAWINMTHEGGQSMPAASTVIYVTDQKGKGASTTDVIHLAPYRAVVTTTTGYGLLDGNGQAWDVGQRFAYENTTMTANDNITVTIVDTSRDVVLWTAVLTPPAGSQPPIFENVWAAGNNAGTPIPVQSGAGFYIFAQVIDPDGSVNPNSVFATLTYYYGQTSCSQPMQMFDDGRTSVDGDVVAHDNIYTFYNNACTGDAVQGMDGSIVLFNATDMQGHQSTTRMVLHVVPGSSGSSSTPGVSTSGQPQNLRWNGNQGFNIFNATQWDTYGFAATPTRTFKPSETVVVVIASTNLQNTFTSNAFDLWDPYSGNTMSPVVYGNAKTVGQASQPSTSSAFSPYTFINGYYVYTYRFELNDANTVGVNFYTSPPAYPRYYYFAAYPLSVLVIDSNGDRFSTADNINITATSGAMRTFPAITTFADPGFTRPGTSFLSSATVYVQVKMFTVDSNASMGNVFFGNILLEDFSGHQQINRAPINGIYSNLPICPPAGPCSGGKQAIWSNSFVTAYQFALNLAGVNQDPWVPGTQTYSLTLTLVRDSDESYTSLATQITVTAPQYKLDLFVGAAPNFGNGLPTMYYSYFYQDVNGYNSWKNFPVDACVDDTTFTTSGINSGNGFNCPTVSNVRVAVGDFWHDGTLGIAETIAGNNGASPPNAVVIWRRTAAATGAITYLPVFFDYPSNPTCTAIAVGDITGNGLPSVVCGGSNGWVWYYANNGNWTRVYVDQPASGQQINHIAIGDFNGDGLKDIAVAGANGYMKWYPNLGGGRFQNTGISDNWFANSEQIKNGTISSGSSLSTYVKDGVYEQLTEGILSVPQYTGSTVNAGMNGSAANWTFASAYNGATGQTLTTGGVGNGPFAQVTAPFKASSTVAGYWYQSFTVTGSPPYTATVNLAYELPTLGATAGSATFYAFVDPTNAAPPQSPTSANYVWTSGTLTATRAWTTVTGISVGNKITAPGTYYLKVAMYVSDGLAGSSTIGGFDNVGLSWSSTAGQTSALEQYWQLGPMPTRPGTTFTFNFYGHRSPSGGSLPDNDNFTLSYATNVVGSNPQSGTYTSMFTVTSTSDASYTAALPAAAAGKTVWIRATDTVRTVGATQLDNLLVDQIYINANTPAGPTGVSLVNPGDSSAVNSIDAQDQNFDGYADLVVGTNNGNVFKFMGSSGGLLTPSGTWYSAGTSNPIVGVRFGNFSTNFPGLDIAVAFGTTVRIIRGDVANGVILSNLPAFSPSSPITALAVGDVNGAGWDDVVVGTSAGGMYLWENLGQGTSWTNAVTLDQLGGQVYSLCLGDSTNSQYLGR